LKILFLLYIVTLLNTRTDILGSVSFRFTQFDKTFYRLPIRRRTRPFLWSQIRHRTSLTLACVLVCVFFLIKFFPDVCDIITCRQQVFNGLIFRPPGEGSSRVYKNSRQMTGLSSSSSTFAADDDCTRNTRTARFIYFLSVDTKHVPSKSVSRKASRTLEKL